MKYLSPFIASFLIAFVSCSEKEDVMGFTQNFFTSLSDTTYGKPSDYYPLYDSLEIKAKSDLVEIEEENIIENNDTFKISCFNNYTDPSGTFRQDSILLFVAKDSIGDLFIYDSKGLVDMDKDTKWYAKVTGAIDDNLPNDVTLGKRLRIIKTMMFTEYIKTRLKLAEKVKLLNWSWETSEYSGDAHGEGRVVNNMDISISDIEYQIYYYDRNGNFMAEDNGNINKTLYP